LSFPFIIWCRQRTGSNSLLGALCSVSEHPVAPTEPFDDAGIVEDRQFSDVGKRMNPADRDAALRSICDQKLLIKHCYENLSEEFNLALAEISTRAGYRHIHLRRRDELARLISKGVAEQHGTWLPTEWTASKFDQWKADGRKLPPLDVPALKRYHELSESRWRSLAGMLLSREVASEELFSNPEVVLSGLADHLGVPRAKVPTMRKGLGAGQSTPSIWDLIPNIEELKLAIPMRTINENS
jgi:hypothetical protein